MVCSLQISPSDPCLWGSPPTAYQGWYVWPTGYNRSAHVLEHKRHCHSASFSFGSHALEEASYCAEDTQAALQRGFTTQGTEAIYQQPAPTCQPHEGTPPLGNRASKQDYSPSQHLDYNLIRGNNHHNSDKLLLNSWTTETVKDNKCLLF